MLSTRPAQECGEETRHVPDPTEGRIDPIEVALPRQPPNQGDAPMAEDIKHEADSYAHSALSKVSVRHRTFVALAVCATIGVGGMTLAQHARKGQGKVTRPS